MSKEALPAASPGESLDASPQEESKPQWKISKRGLLVFVTICVLTLMVAIDSTSIGVVLPVSPMHSDAMTQDEPGVDQHFYLGYLQSPWYTSH